MTAADRLATCRARRNLQRRARGPRRFAVQKLAARTVHYDFRLEVDGVPRAW